jgi:hypothetical protein
VRSHSQPPELLNENTACFRRQQITQRIRRVIAAVPVLVRIHLQHILRPVRISDRDGSVDTRQMLPYNRNLPTEFNRNLLSNICRTNT